MDNSPVEVKEKKIHSEGVPPKRAIRDDLHAKVRTYVREQHIHPPLSLEQLQQYSQDLLNRFYVTPDFEDYVTVLISNEIWADKLASIPFERLD